MENTNTTKANYSFVADAMLGKIARKLRMIRFINLQQLPYLCTCCNGLLDTITDKSFINHEIPIHVLNNNKMFYECRKCSKIYWKGSHIEHISRLIKRINSELSSLTNLD